MVPRSRNGRTLPTRDNDKRKFTLYYNGIPIKDGEKKAWGVLEQLKKSLIASGRYTMKNAFNIK